MTVQNIRPPTVSAVVLAAVVPSLVVLVNGLVTNGRGKGWASPGVAVASGAVVVAATIGFYDRMTEALGPPAWDWVDQPPPPPPPPPPGTAAGPRR